MTQFLIDTNSIIEAKDFFYAFDICPGFWNALLRHHQLGEIYSIHLRRREFLIQMFVNSLAFHTAMSMKCYDDCMSSLG